MGNVDIFIFPSCISELYSIPLYMACLKGSGMVVAFSSGIVVGPCIFVNPPAVSYTIYVAIKLMGFCY